MSNERLLSSTRQACCRPTAWAAPKPIFDIRFAVLTPDANILWVRFEKKSDMRASLKSFKSIEQTVHKIV
jgi:hypothetical protein